MSLNKRLMSSQPASFVASENFKVVTWTGDAVDDRAIEVGFKPDFVWYKTRNQNNDHNVSDSTRGAAKQIRSNRDLAEISATDQIKSFTSTGFTVGTGGDANASGNTYVAWCWKAGGGTTSTNTDGSNIDSTVQVNANAGFSIVKWTGTGNAAHTVGHGLGVTPNMVLSKNLDQTDTWQVYHSGAGSGAKFGGHLDSSAAFNTSAGTHGAWNTPSSTALTFSNGSSSIDNLNTNNENYIAYCFADIDGFSKFGSYIGNGSANGPIVETGFEPAFLMIKRTSASDNWVLIDNERSTTNPRNKFVWANMNNAESTFAGTREVNFYSNGFQLVSDGSDDINDSSANYIYMAFAADPDEVAPELESSFNIETWTGNDGTQDINVGFKPGLIWLKNRNNSGDSTHDHSLFDILRGTFRARSSSSGAANDYASHYGGINDNGFQVKDGLALNDVGGTYVAWAWKADDNEATIEEVTEDADAKAIYTLESDADDVTGNYDATESGITYNSGKFGNAATYSGTNASSGSKIYVSNSVYGSSTSTFTVSLWIKCTNTSGEIPIAGNGGTIGGTTGYAIYLNSGKLALTFRTNPNQNFYADTTSINDDEWHHVALTCNNGDYVLYLDNLVNASGTTSNWTGNPTPTFDTYFGNRWNRNESGVIAGQIDQIRIYDKALTAASITNLYNETTSQNSTLDIGTQAIVSAKSIVSTNANAGFSIVKYNNATGPVPHGLSTTPRMIIQKKLNDTQDWYVYFPPGVIDSNYNYMVLNDDAAKGTTSSTAPTATTFNAASDSGEYIAYCFHDVTGYSKIGSYAGNGTTQTITTGFRPDFVMIKASTNSTAYTSWTIIDSVRYESSSDTNPIYANLSAAEGTRGNGSGDGDVLEISFTSTGFKLGDTSSDNGSDEMNDPNNDYIYMAFKKNVPSNTTLANSFKAITYTGTRSPQSITGLGFKPDLVWIKQLGDTNTHGLWDSVRGAGPYLSSSSSDAQLGDPGNLMGSFDADGFSVNSNYLTYTAHDNTNKDGTNSDYVAWCWKAGNTWQSNMDGTIPSITNTNTANGFSIVKYTGTGSATTVGHGLSGAPEMIIVKNISNAHSGNAHWAVYHTGVGHTKVIYLNRTNTEGTSSAFWNDTAPTSSVFSIGTDNDVNVDGENFIAYCFDSINGYSKFGTYEGTGSSNSITGLGFKPDFVMVKNIDSTRGWQMFDSTRGANQLLFASSNSDESDETAGTSLSSFDSDGFTVGTGNGVNEDDDTFIYYAVRNALQPQAGNMSFLVVAGGGSGGNRHGGGGGAGGLRTSYGNTSGGGASAESDITLSAGTYTITVGTGGTGVSYDTTAGNNGAASSIAASSMTTISTVGGGGGGIYHTPTGSHIDGSDGGAGGGGGSASSKGVGTANQGYAGGDGGGQNAPDYGGAGGGGASAVGSDGANDAGGDGGAGLAVSITGSSVAYAGGGGGSSFTNHSARGTGGNGGGGDGAGNLNTGGSGTANTGGGGGGTTYDGGYSGAGGSGVVILRLLTSEYSGSTTGSPTVTTDGDYKVLKYTSSGTYVHS